MTHRLHKIEHALDGVFNKRSPYQLSEKSRKSLTSSAWWLALVFGLVELWSAWGFWYLGHQGEKSLDYPALAYGIETVNDELGFFYYLALVVAGVSAALLLLASAGLIAKRKVGWNLALYGLLLSVIYVVARLFSIYSSLVCLLIGLVAVLIGIYVLFQVRDHFKKT